MSRVYFTPAQFYMDINKEAHYSYSSQPVKSIEPPKSTSIGIGPATVVGAITGALIGANANAKRKRKEEEIYRNMAPKQKTPILEGGYYNQVEHIAKNLRVIFTPMSVVYVLENNKKPFTLDTIEISEMNDEMKNAWKSKNENYFARMMILKMYSDMQSAEQKFSKMFLEKQVGIKNTILKQASENIYEDEISDIEVLAHAVASKSIYEKMAKEHKDSISDALGKIMENQASEMEVTAKLNRPVEKYANVKNDIKHTLGISSDVNSVKKLKKKLDNPSYVARNIEVAFLPDRVVFLLDNTLVSTIDVSRMDQEKFINFKKENTKFFKAIFANQCKQNMSKTASEDIASETNYELNEIFFKSDIHPVVYYLALTYKYGFEWFEFDTAIIDRIIKNDFGFTEDISDIALDKILAIHTANNSTLVYENAFCFEKIALSLSEKPVDFFSRTPELLNIDDIVYVIDIIDRVTPSDDIYDNFSSEVLDYICGVLSRHSIYTYNPQNIVSSPTEPAFNEMVNESLVRIMKKKMTLHTDDPLQEKIIKDKVDYISNTSYAILKTLRRYIDAENKTSEMTKLVDELIVKSNVRKDLSNIVKEQVIMNLMVDDILKSKEDMLAIQMEKYKVNNPGGETNE